MKFNKNAITAVLYTFFTLVLGFSFGQSWNNGWQIPIGVTASVFVAIMSFAITIHHYHSIRQHNELLVKPHLIIDSHFSSVIKEDYQTFRLAIKNVGLGPALVEQYSLTLGGKEIRDADSAFVEFLRIVNAVTPAKGRGEVIAMYLQQGEAIDKGAEKILFQASFPTESRSFMKGREIAIKLADEIEFSIRYHCHYDRKFNVEGKRTKNAPTLGASIAA